eukprot:2949648-Alexandrium_andersonii.AAC.1
MFNVGASLRFRPVAGAAAAVAVAVAGAVLGGRGPWHFHARWAPACLNSLRVSCASGAASAWGAPSTRC